jgi:hypothetical protein
MDVMGKNLGEKTKSVHLQHCGLGRELCLLTAFLVISGVKSKMGLWRVWGHGSLVDLVCVLPRPQQRVLAAAVSELDLAQKRFLNSHRAGISTEVRIRSAMLGTLRRPF